MGQDYRKYHLYRKEHLTHVAALDIYYERRESIVITGNAKIQTDTRYVDMPLRKNIIV